MQQPGLKGIYYTVIITWTTYNAVDTGEHRRKSKIDNPDKQST